MNGGTDRVTRTAVRALAPGEKLTARGVIAERLANGDVRYSVQVMVDGERIARVIGRESEGCTPTQAEEYIAAVRTKAREGRLDLPKGRKTALSFAEAADKYLRMQEQGAGRNVPRKRQHLRTYLKPHFGDRRLSGISDFLVRNFVKQRKDAGAAASTINGELATFSHLFKIAAAEKWVSRDAVPTIPRLQPGRGRIIALSDEQSSALLKGAIDDQDPDLWLFVLIGLQTSMRHGEIRRLRWQYFDANRRRFFIPEAKAGEREQPLATDLTAVLMKERESRVDQKGYLFAPGPGSKTRFRVSFAKAFRRAVERAKLDSALVTPHVMRHTAITRLVKAGVDLATVQRVSGHKTLAMVLRYTHVDGLHIDAAAEKLVMPVSCAITTELPVVDEITRRRTRKMAEKVVPRDGVEPPTLRFSVACSTN